MRPPRVLHRGTARGAHGRKRPLHIYGTLRCRELAALPRGVHVRTEDPFYVRLRLLECAQSDFVRAQIKPGSDLGQMHVAVCGDEYVMTASAASTYRNEMKSFWFAKVMTRFASSFGTGNRKRSALRTRSPSRPPKPSKIRCGYCSLTVLLP